MIDRLDKPTIYDLEEYEPMINRVKLSTFMTNNLYLYGMVLKKDYKTVDEIKANLPTNLCLFDEIETAMTYGFKRINDVTNISEGRLITVQIDPSKILDTLNLSGIKCLSDTYTEMYKLNQNVFKPKKGQDGRPSKPVNPDSLIVKYLRDNKRITGVRRLITEGDKLYTNSIFREARYIRYDIYDRNIIQNITLTN